MKRNRAFALLFAASAALVAAPASAQDWRYDSGARAPSRAFEITAGMSGTAGFGRAGQQRITDIGDIADAGLELDLSLGARVNPYFSAELAGSYQWYRAGGQLDYGATARGMSGDAGGTFHFAPFTYLDPWLRVATGYRAIYEVSGPGRADPLVHGFELLKLGFGLDLRAGPLFAIAPFVAADFNAFIYDREDPLFTENGRLYVNTFIHGGVLGRFDIGGRLQRSRWVVASDVAK